MEDVLQALLSRALTNGWDGIEGAPERVALAQKRDFQERSERTEHEAAIVKEAAATPEGRALLDLLIRKTIMTGPSQEEIEARSVETFALLKAKRDGANGVVFMLLNLLRFARGEIATTEGGTP